MYALDIRALVGAECTLNTRGRPLAEIREWTHECVGSAVLDRSLYAIVLDKATGYVSYQRIDAVVYNPATISGVI